MWKYIYVSGTSMSAFSAKITGNVLSSGVMTFTTTMLNEGNDYNAATDVFTCRIPGFYFFSSTLTTVTFIVILRLMETGQKQ